MSEDEILVRQILSRQLSRRELLRLGAAMGGAGAAAAFLAACRGILVAARVSGSGVRLTFDGCVSRQPKSSAGRRQARHRRV